MPTTFVAFSESIDAFHSARVSRIRALVRAFPPNTPADVVGDTVASETALPAVPQVAAGEPTAIIAGRDGDVVVIQLAFPLTAEGELNMLRYRVPRHAHDDTGYGTSTESRIQRLREGWVPEPAIVDPAARSLAVTVTERELRLAPFRTAALRAAIAATLGRLAEAVMTCTPAKCIALDMLSQRSVAAATRDETDVLRRLAELGLRAARRQAEADTSAEPVIVGPDLSSREENDQ